MSAIKNAMAEEWVTRLSEGPNEADNPRAVPGNNMPPEEPTPFDAVKKRIDDLYDEAVLWLDGKPIETTNQAEGVANLLRMIQEAADDANALRTTAKAPFDEGVKAVQALYHPLIGDTKTAGKGKAVQAIDACKAVQAAWLKKLDDELKAKAIEERQKADEALAKAQAALKAAEPTDLAARGAAEGLVRDASRAEKAATSAAKATATVKGVTGRAVGLRSNYVAEMTDFREAARHYWTAEPERMRAFIQSLADTDVRTGKRDIPGFKVSNDARAA